MQMNNKNLEKKMLNSTKWSTLGEVAAKLISPITNMILARLLIPADFGIVASITMIISFADIFTDAGFQKYLIQADIEDKQFDETANVAFWSNLALSIIIWLIIYISRFYLASSIGIKDLANVLPIATITIIISAFTTIQIGIFRRNFYFKKLFFIRMIGAFIPLVITVPLAIIGFKYWAIILGNIILALVNSLLFFIFSEWRPKLRYSTQILKKMLSFSIWSLIEAISIWLTSWIDAFIISTKLSKESLGIYRTGTTTINGILSIITGSTTPVLFSGLSKLKNDNQQFKEIFYKMQRYVAFVIFPIGVGIYVFRSFATFLFLGNGWHGAELVIGNWALTSAIMIVFGNYCSEVYRAKGKPKLSFIAQMLHLVFLIPVIIISININFETLVIARSWARLQFVLIHFIFMKKYFNISFISVINNVKEVVISSVIMGVVGYLLLTINNNILYQLIWIVLSIFTYLLLLLIQKKSRKELFEIISLIRKRRKI